MHRDVLVVVHLRLKKWFLEPEMMVKARHLGIHILEMDVFERMRGKGVSRIRALMCRALFRNLMALEFGRSIHRWRRAHPGFGAMGERRRRAPVVRSCRRAGRVLERQACFRPTGEMVS